MTPLYAESVYLLDGSEESVRMGLYLNWKSGTVRPLMILTCFGQEVKIPYEHWLSFKVHMQKFTEYLDREYVYEFDLNLSNHSCETHMLCSSGKYEKNMKFSIRHKGEEKAHIVTLSERAMRYLFKIRFLLYNLFYSSYIFNESKIKADVLAFFTSRERDVFRGEPSLQFDLQKLMGELNILD